MLSDYINITAHNGVIRPIWTRMDSGATSIWTALVSQSALSNPEFGKETSDIDVKNYPNPTSDESYFSFKLYKDSFVTIKIYDLSGKEVYEITNQNFPMGKHVVSMKSNTLKPGEYIYKIKTDYYIKSKKMIVN